MKDVKSIILLASIFVLVFLTIEPAFASLTVDFNQKTAHVNDTVTITVSASNTDLYDWSPVIVYAPYQMG